MIGDTVSTASRLPQLTCSLATPLVAGDPLIIAVSKTLPSPEIADILAALRPWEHELRGRSEPVRIWTRASS